MRKIPTELAEPGMILSHSVYTPDGKVLLSAGVSLTAYYIQRLATYEIPAIYVQDGLTDDVDIAGVVSEETRVGAIREMKKAFNQIRLAGSADLRPLREMANSIIDQVLSNKHLLFQLHDVRCHDQYTFGHSVSVCVLSVLTGMMLGFNQLQLRDLATGALLHDIGKIKVPKEIINKPGKLNDEELNTMKQHTTWGYHILRQHADTIPLLAAHVALQHHERFDGNGYPQGLKGEKIHEYARVVAVADVFDALIANRPYRREFLPHEAYEIIQAASLTHFDSRIAKIFLDNVAVYPVGTMVKITTGEVGIVVDVKRGQQHRPIINLLFSDKGTPLPRRELDLAHNPSILINKVFKEEEAFKLIRDSIETNQANYAAAEPLSKTNI